MLWKIAALYIASVIGAGFATGQEIIQFFGRFGIIGLGGLLLATILLSILPALAIKKCCQLQTRNYKELLHKTCGRAAPFLDLLYTFFLFIGLAVMFSGAEETLYQVSGYRGGLYITAALVLILLLLGPEQVVNAAAKIVPVMVGLIICVSGYALITGRLNITSSNSVVGLSYGILYAGYNVGFSLAVFAGITSLITNDSQAAVGGLIGGLVLGLLVLIMLLGLWSAPLYYQNTPIPMLYLAGQISNVFKLIYAVTIWLAMYTTALSHGLAIALRLSSPGAMHWKYACTAIIGIAIIISYYGFVALIKVAYPLFGVVGLFLLVKLLQFNSES